jgi:hypothetical protein
VRLSFSQKRSFRGIDIPANQGRVAISMASALTTLSRFVRFAHSGNALQAMKT